LYLQSSCFSLLNAEIVEVHPHVWLDDAFNLRNMTAR
jgi:hypothetical protein